MNHNDDLFDLELGDDVIDQGEEEEAAPKRARLQQNAKPTALHVDDDEIPVSSSYALDDPSATAIKRAQTLMNRSIQCYMQANCPTKLGLTCPLMLVNQRDSNDVSAATISVVHMCCLTVPINAMVNGASYFGEFNTTSKLGRNAFRAFQFLRKAFCDPTIGDDPNYINPLKSPRASTIGRQFRNRVRVPKVMPIVEPLFRNIKKFTNVPDHLGNMVRTPGRPLTKVEMFADDNVLGFRVWFFITDTQIDMTRALIARIVANNEEVGRADNYCMVSVDSPAMQALCSDHMKGDPTRLQTFVSKLNNAAAKANIDNLKRRVAFDESKYGKPDGELLAYEIDSVTALYNLFRVWFSRCLNCKQFMVCDDCAHKPSAIDEIKRIRNSTEDILAEYEAECLIAERDGYDLPPFPDLSVTYETARFTNLPASDIIAEIIDGSVLASDPVLEDLISEMVAPELYFIHTNPTDLAYLRKLGVCEEQLSAGNYTDMASREHTPIAFPFPEYVFSFSAKDFFSDEFVNVKLPWVFDSFSLLIDCVQEVVKDRRNAETAREHSEFFDSITGGEAYNVLKRAEESSKKILASLPPPIPKELQSAQYVASDQAFARICMPLPENSLNDEENRLGHRNEIREGAVSFGSKINRLRDCARFLDDAIMQHLLKMMRDQGMRELKRLTIGNSNTSASYHRAAKRINDLIQADQSGFHYTKRVAHNLKSSFADYAGHLYFYFESEGVINTHAMLFEFLLAAYRSCHVDIADKLFGHTMLHIHIIVQGTAATDKTHTINILKRMTLPNTVVTISTASERAGNTLNSQDGRVKFCDELPSWVDGGKMATPDAMARRLAFKEVTTSHKKTHLFCTFGKDNDPNSRVTKTIVTHDCDAMVFAGNDLKANPNKEHSILSRLTVLIANLLPPRHGAVDLAEQSTPFKASLVTNLLTSHNGELRRNMINLHAFHMIYAKGIALGAFTYPCIDMLSCHFIPVYAKLSKIMPSISKMVRYVEQMTARALVLAISHALYLVFNSVWSPLVSFDSYKRKVKYPTFCLDQLGLAEPHTFLPEDAAISLIVNSVHTNFLPAVNWEVVYMCAQFFCSFDLNPSVLCEPTYNTVEENGVVYVKKDYLRFPCDIATVISWLNKRGVNEDSARFIIRTLMAVTINVHSYAPIPVSAPGSSGRSLASNVASRAMPAKSLTRSGMPVCSLLAPIDRCNSETATFDASILLLNTHYLEQMSPSQITDLIVKTVCHSGTVERDIAINSLYQELPFLMKTVHLAPNNKHFKLSSTEKLDSTVRQALTPGGLSFNKSKPVYPPFSAASSSSASPFSTNARGGRASGGRNAPIDLESVLCMEWLEKSCILPMPPSHYTPRNVNRIIEERSRQFSTEPRINYPEGLLAKYTDVVSTPLTLQPLTDPGSSGMENMPTPIPASATSNMNLSRLVTKFATTPLPYSMRQAEGDRTSFSNPSFAPVRGSSAPSAIAPTTKRLDM